MILIGMYDSPFVRRVAVTLKSFELPFEHLNWSVGADFDRIREYNPLGRVPTLVLDDGEALVESSAILDYLDEFMGPARALLAPGGAARREQLQWMSLAVGAGEKARDQIYEGVFRPPEKRHAPWLERCRTQMYAALAELEKICSRNERGAWMSGSQMSQADVTLTCFVTFMNEAVMAGVTSETHPGIAALVSRCEGLPEFRAVRAPWAAPASALAP